ncbi:MAG: lysophospholipid acyltransferase family protein [Candidatus Eisenbacteria bacterium]
MAAPLVAAGPRPAPFASLLLATLARAAVRSTPREAETAGAALGDLRRHLRPGEVRAVRGNLALLSVRGAAADTRARAIFHAFGLFVIEFLRGLETPPEDIAAGWTVEGMEHLRTLSHARTGFILAGAHTGNWEHLGALGSLCGRRIVSPTGIQLHRGLSAAVKSRKAGGGVHSVPEQAGLRGLAAALARGDLVGLPIDGGSFRRGIAVSFCGRELAFPAGPARLALMSGRPIVPVFSRRTGFMRQDVRIGAPLWPPPADCLKADPSLKTRAAHELTAHLARALAEHLNVAADQWCIFRPLGTAAGGGRRAARMPADARTRAAHNPRR